MDWIVPKRLHKGMTLAFLAPASACQEDLDLVKAICQERGYQAIFAPSCYGQGLYGESEEEMVEEINSLFRDPSVHAIICARGGYGTMRYLDKIDFAAIRRNPKAFVGYSDITALHLSIQKMCQLVTFHGPMVVDWCKAKDPSKAGSQEAMTSYQEDLDQLFQTLEGQVRIIEPLPEPPRGHIGTQLGEGRLIGGNMTLIAMMGGTPYGLDSYSRKELESMILFLEDVGEAPYKLDRMLQQLRIQGILGAIKGIALGTFRDCQGDPDEASYDIGYQVLRYMEEGRPEEADPPFVCYLPTGHGTPHVTLPLGGLVSFRYIANTFLLQPYTK